MNFGIKIKGEFLELKPNQVISFNTRNLIFSGSSSDILPGSFQIPTTVNLTDVNKRLLRHPHLVTNAGDFLENEPVEVIAGSSLTFEGELSVKTANEFEAQIYTVINPLSKLKKVNIRDLDLGGERTIGNSSSESRLHAKDTAENPLNHDYIFFPVYNKDFQESPKEIGSAFLFQNYWDAENQEFFEGKESPAAMPFVRVDYLLSKIFEGIDYKFENKWQITDELKKLVTYSNYSIYHDSDHNPDAEPKEDPIPDTWETTINLSNHIPKVSNNEYVKSWMRVFALGLFPNYQDKLLELIPIRDLLKKPAKHDWTGKLLRGYSVDATKDNAPDAYSFEIEDEIQEGLQETYNLPEEFIVVPDLKDVPASPPGNIPYYYIENRDIYVVSGSFPARPSRKALKYSDLGTSPKYDTDNEALIKPAPLHDFFFGERTSDGFDIRVSYDGFDHFVPGEVRAFPAIYQPGTISQINQTNDLPFRFTIYRGMYPNKFGQLYPYANGMPFDPTGNPIGEYALHWTSPTGLYEKWYRQWHEMIRYGKRVKATFKLSLSDYLKFNYKDKIRVGSMDYFVKSMKVSFTSKGLLPVECELVSVI